MGLSVASERNPFQIGLNKREFIGLHQLESPGINLTLGIAQSKSSNGITGFFLNLCAQHPLSRLLSPIGSPSR